MYFEHEFKQKYDHVYNEESYLVQILNRVLKMIFSNNSKAKMNQYELYYQSPNKS